MINRGKMGVAVVGVGVEMGREGRSGPEKIHLGARRWGWSWVHGAFMGSDEL